MDKTEKTRLCNLSLRDAANSVLKIWDTDGPLPYKEIEDLRYVLDNNPVEKKVKS